MFLLAGIVVAEGFLRHTDKQTNCASLHLSVQPKSGSTWLEFVLAAVTDEYCSVNHCSTNNGGSADGWWGIDFAEGHPRTTSLKTVNRKGKHTMRVLKEVQMHYVKEPEIGQDAALQEIQKADWASLDRSIKASGLKDRDERKCYIYMFRDPRDVALSACHYFHQGSECNADQYLADRISSYSAWTQLRYAEYKSLSQVAPDQHFEVFFSDLSRTFVPTVVRLADSIGMPITEAQAEAIEKAVSIDKMRKAEKRDETLMDRSVLSRGGSGDKIRKGATCGFKSEVAEKTAEAVTSKMNSVLSDELAQMFDCEK